MLLTAEILHHLLGMKPYEKWDILQINWRKISSINSTSQLVYQIPEPARVSHEKNVRKHLHPVSLGTTGHLHDNFHNGIPSYPPANKDSWDFLMFKESKILQPGKVVYFTPRKTKLDTNNSHEITGLIKGLTTMINE